MNLEAETPENEVAEQNSTEHLEDREVVGDVSIIQVLIRIAYVVYVTISDISMNRCDRAVLGKSGSLLHPEYKIVAYPFLPL